MRISDSKKRRKKRRGVRIYVYCWEGKGRGGKEGGMRRRSARVFVVCCVHCDSL
jgi:hypothetical protein